MNRLLFEWTPEKATANRLKHGITFEEAATIFADLLSRTMPDPDHSSEESRFIT
ncbi:MAG: BrnT family toxin, partial [Bryobacteraceae bacterium]